MASKTQKEKILNFLKSGRGLTPRTAENRWGVKNLRARIFDLRTEGFEIAKISRNLKGEKITAYLLND